MEMTGIKVDKLVVTLELHADSIVSESHSHYNMAPKLEKKHMMAEGSKV